MRNGKGVIPEEQPRTRLACFFALNRFVISKIIRFAAPC
jgi:hypothetical protein